LTKGIYFLYTVKKDNVLQQTQIFIAYGSPKAGSTENNKIKKYIIIKECSAMFDNYLGRKSGTIAEIEWFWQSVEQVAVVASISPPLLHVALAASNVN